MIDTASKSWLASRNAYGTKNIPRGTGRTYWVSSTGNDGQDGLDIESAFLTIGQATTVAQAGDVIKVAGAVYAENVVLATNYVTIDFEYGSQILSIVVAPGTIGCAFLNMITTAPAGDAITDNGINTLFVNCRALGTPVRAFVLAGAGGGGCILIDCFANGYTATGFDIQANNNRLLRCNALGVGAGCTGFDLSAVGADFNMFRDCMTNNNLVAGWNIAVGADDNTFIHCAQGLGDGAKVDGGANNTWPDWHEDGQIVAGQTIEQDHKDIYDLIGSTGGTSYIGVVTSVAAGTTQFSCLGLANIQPDDLFNTGWRLRVLLNASAVGTYPEGQMSDITDWVAATGELIISPPLTANIEVGDYIQIIKEDIVAKTAQASVLTGTCNTGMGASATSIVCRDLAGYGDDYFNVDWLMQVVYNTNSHGAAPEGDLKEITDYVSDTGTFTTNNFTANVEAGDLIMLIRKEHLNALTECNVKCGRCNVGMAASTITVVCAELAGFSDDFFNNVATQAKWWMTVVKNNSAVMTAPEGETRMITDYVSATGTFTVQPFSANVEANDYIMLIHDSLYNKLELGNIFNLVNSDLVLNETGGSVTTDGTEQNVYINNSPSGVFKPLVVAINFDAMLAGDSVTVRLYDIMAAAGAYSLASAPITYTGADGGLAGGSVKDYIVLPPNRFGIKVTITRTMGTDRAYPWEVFKES